MHCTTNGGCLKLLPGPQLQVAALQGLFLLKALLRRRSPVPSQVARARWRQVLLPTKGSAAWWLKVNLLAVIGSVLQFLRLLSFGGYDLGTQGEIPASADEIVKFQAMVLAADLLSPSFTCLIGSALLCGARF